MSYKEVAEQSARYAQEILRQQVLCAELLAALSTVLDAWSFISERPQPEPMRHAMRVVRAAIAKAKGA